MNTLNLTAMTAGGSVDLTPVSSNFKKSDNLESLGECFSFDLACNPLDKCMNGYSVPVGAKIVFSVDGAVVFAGIVVRISRDGIYRRSVTCYDYGFYLNRSKLFVQFNGGSTDAAIRRICSKAGIPVGKLCSMGVEVWGIYEDKTVADIIKDLLTKYTQATGKKTRLEVRDGKLCIEHYTDMTVRASFKPAANVGAFDPTLVVGQLSIEESIEDMRNSVQVVAGSELHKAVEAQKKDAASVKQYGLLQEVIKIDDKDYFRAPQIAANTLKERNKVARSFKCTLLGDVRVRAGRLLVFDQPILGMQGSMLVTHCEHAWNGTTHTMALELQQGGD